MYFGLTVMSNNEDIQAIVAERAAAREANSPEAKAAAKQKEVADMTLAKQKELDSKPTTFKGPDGFSNVIGVGANPVMEAMTLQLEEQRKQTALLQILASSGITPSDGWLTETARAVLREGR